MFFIYTSYGVSWFYKTTRTFLKVKEQFINNKERHAIEKSVLISHLVEHKKNLCKLCTSFTQKSVHVRNNIGVKLFNCIVREKLNAIIKSNILKLTCKRKELKRLISQKTFRRNNDDIPVVSLSS